MVCIEETLTTGITEFSADAPITKIQYLMYALSSKHKKDTPLFSAILLAWYTAKCAPG